MKNIIIKSQMKPIDKFGIWTIVLGVLYFLGHLFWWWLK